MVDVRDGVRAHYLDANPGVEMGPDFAQPLFYPDRDFAGSGIGILTAVFEAAATHA
jgi:hypothetical protein